MSPRASRSTAALAAYLLHRWDWSETSLIIDLFTREQGRIAVAARGAKRPYSQLRPVLLPFQRLNVSLGRKAAEEAAEVQTLRGAEWAGGPPMLAGDALFSGFYLNELLLRLLARHDPHPALFDAYAATLPALADGGDAAQAAIRAFEFVLLRESGLLPELSAVTTTLEPLQPQRRYALRPEAGVAAASGDEPALAGERWIALQAALDDGRIEPLRSACLPVQAVLRGVLRGLLHYHLGSSQPLRTRALMLDVQKLLE
jgi:DNA repair protein RecO (recombination protein O)